MPDSCAGISFTVAMALSCQIANAGHIVYSSYGFVMPDSCAGVSFTVAMALSCQIVSAGVSFTVAISLSCQIAMRAYRLQ